MKKNLLLPVFLFSIAVRLCNGQCTPFIQAVPNTIFPCHGGACDGMLIINPVWINGTPPYTFTSNFGTVVPDQPNPGWTSIINLCAGSNVVVNIADAAGCTGVDAVTMIETPPVNPSFTITPSCNSLDNGSVSIGNIPDWYWQRSLTVNNLAGWTVISTEYNTGETSPLVVNNLLPGNYTFVISFQMTDYNAPWWFGCTQTFPFTVPAATFPSALITPAGPTTFCSGGSVVLNAPAGTNKTYQWKKGANLISGATQSSYTATTGGNYRVIVTNTVTGCSKTTGSAITVTVKALPAATITPQGPTTFCAGGSVVLQANTGAGLTYKWKKGSNYISGATLSNYTATTGGNYRVQVTNSNGCSKVSALVAVSVPCKEGESVKVEEGESVLDFTVYPNPNLGEFTIKFLKLPSSPIQIELTDEIGKVVKRFETNDETVVVKESTLAKGIYCLIVRNKDEVVIKKITII
ncbi:MAG TPA: T9SS type A sorting domain-containing protein [Bacteroidia bacterium]|nr:T9SS type A sorting domain-containing protein [Bacteroidia bacterium]